MPRRQQPHTRPLKRHQIGAANQKDHTPTRRSALTRPFGRIAGKRAVLKRIVRHSPLPVDDKTFSLTGNAATRRRPCPALHLSWTQSLPDKLQRGSPHTRKQTYDRRPTCSALRQPTAQNAARLADTQNTAQLQTKRRATQFLTQTDAAG